jgi:mono/diheme cytochrome c family protein
MRGRLAGVALVAALALVPGAGAPASADEKVSATLAGSVSYRTHCATCHGADGKGEGPMTDNLRVHPPDLTLLAKRNEGRFPADAVRRIIDGRSPMKGHGGPEMPVWGDAFRSSSDAYSEAKVAEKIAALVEYLKSIQAAVK